MKLDRMLDLGFAPELRRIANAAKHRRRQMLMFSATLDHAEVNGRIANEMLDAPKRILLVFLTNSPISPRSSTCVTI